MSMTAFTTFHENNAQISCFRTFFIFTFNPWEQSVPRTLAGAVCEWVDKNA